MIFIFISFWHLLADICLFVSFKSVIESLKSVFGDWNNFTRISQIFLACFEGWIIFIQILCPIWDIKRLTSEQVLEGCARLIECANAPHGGHWSKKMRFEKWGWELRFHTTTLNRNRDLKAWAIYLIEKTWLETIWDLFVIWHELGLFIMS